MDGIDVIRVASYLSHNKNGLARALSYLSFSAACMLSTPFLPFRPQAIYVYNLVTLVPVAGLMRLLWGAKVVIDVQDLWPESVVASGMMGKGDAPKALQALCDFAYRAVDGIIAQSPGFARRLIHRGARGDRIRVVYNWAPQELSVARVKNEKSHNQFRILYAGNLGTVQALDVIIDAAILLQDLRPEVVFSIIGRGTDEERLRKRATHLSNVEFLGWIAPAGLVPHYENSDALLLHLSDNPLFRMTIPSKLQQYLQIGRPILCGVPGDASDLVEESRAGVSFTSCSPSDLVRAVGELLALTQTELDAMGKRGSEFYRLRLDMAQGLREIEQHLLA